MGAALKLLRELFEKIGLEIDRRTAASLLVLLVILVLLPVGLFLIKQRQIFTPKAQGELISLGDGGCIKVNKDKQKVVDCSLVPLKLTNPFFDINAVTATPAASTGGSANPKVVRVNGRTDVEIQAALDSIKNSGGAVYLPAGTYLVSTKIRLLSNTTLFGDGIDRTIIKFAPGVNDHMMGNDSTNGQQNIVIRDLTLQGPGLQNYNASNCCNGVPYGLKLEDLSNAYVINVAVDDFPSHGIYLGYKLKNGQPFGVRNTRLSGCRANNNGGIGIYLVETDNVVVDHCVVQNSGRIQPIDGITAGPDNGTSVRNSKILSNTVINNKGNGIGLASCHEAHKDAPVNNVAVCNNTADPNDFAALRQHKCNSGVFGNIFINNIDHGEFDNTGGGDILNSPVSACDIPASLANLPPLPVKPTSVLNKNFGLVKEALAQTNPGSDKLLYRLAESQAGLEQAAWKEFALLPIQTKFALKSSKFNPFIPEAYAVDSDDIFLNRTQEGTTSASPGPGSSGTTSTNIGVQFINTTFQLSNSQISPKQIWVQFLHPDGTSRIDNVNFNLVEKPPLILGLSCNLDISKENLRITIEGERLGNAVGTVESVSPSAKPEVLGWNNSQITAFLKKPNIPINEGQRFKIKITRPDGFESPTATCAVDKSLVSLGVRIFCREPGKFDQADVLVDLLYNSADPGQTEKLNKIQEKVTINADGEIANLKTKLQVGKNYAISIKAPSTVRRTTVFTAQEGTTQIVQPDGNPFILPIGDIAPRVSPDGQINTLDRSELIRQWRILGTDALKQTGDFNRDSKVNSIDWACMNYDFGASNDSLPVALPQSASGSIHIPGGEDSMTIPSSSTSPTPAGSQTPVPSPSKDTSNSITIDLGGKLFLDTNRNKTPDIGESYISQGLATVKLLQVPEDHVVGTPLTTDELGDSRVLAQVNNNLPGANYDISVFVDKDSGTKFSLLSTANSGQLTGTYDFSVGPPLVNTNLVINLPVTSATQ